MAQKSLLKRVVSSFTALAIATVAMPVIPAFAEAGTVSYSFDGYDVEYSVKNEWTDGQSIEVKITNTGDEPILNWAFKYDAEGEINGLWNASVYDTKETSYIIKNVGWNYEIAPDASVSFGYTLSDYSGTNPDKFELCAKRVDKTEGYDVQYNITNEWDTGLQGEIVITNTSEEPLEAWELSFDSTFEINNLWNGKIISSEDNHYVVASEMWSNPISAGSSVTIGFTGNKVDETELTINNTKVSVVEISKLEENPVEIDWEDDTDTDGDGLPDVYEIYAYETDPNNPDTDKDGLPDGYEAITLRTNPATADSNDNGVNDGDEDFDDDGLFNLEEYQKETNPYVADTDKDGLKDGEEVHIYNTDPLKYDTDGDGVFDGDEVLLGLDPNNPEDGATPVHQVIAEEELEINDFIDEYKISIDIVASDNVKDYLIQDVSRYSTLLSANRAIIGEPIDIEYEAGTIVSGTISFRLDEDFIDNNSHYYPELDLGLDRYGVFIYDDTVKTIVPIPCDYDEDNNTIIIDAKNMGNLMIIDYESLMYDLGVDIETIKGDISDEKVETEEADISVRKMSVAMLSASSDEEIESYPSDEDTTRLIPSRQVDLVLAVDTTGSMGSQIYTIRNNLNQLIEKLREDDISLYVSIIDFRDITCDGKDSTKVNNRLGDDFYNSKDKITSILNSLSANGGGDTPECAIDALGAAYYLNYRENAAKFIFLITDAPYKVDNNYAFRDMNTVADLLKGKGIYTSAIVYPYCNSYYKSLTDTTSGRIISMSGDFCDEMYKFINEKTPAYSVVVANSLVTGSFKEPLKKGSSCDTDEDKVTDSDEIDWSNVKNEERLEFYTWYELCKRSSFFHDGQYNWLYNYLNGIKVIPAVSNPFSKDTDGDYYPDNIDDDDLNSNAMLILDKKLDDTYLHGNTKPTVADDSSDNFTDGKFNANNLTYTFTRHPNKIYEFSLTPEKTSFYNFELVCYDYLIKVYSLGLKNKKEEVLKDEHNSYLLEKGKQYTVKIKAKYSLDYYFKVRQDNWIYAEYGAICTAHEDITVFDSADYQSIYISDKGLYKIIDNYYAKSPHPLSMSYEQFINVVDTGERNETNPFYDSCILNERILNEAQSYGDAMLDSINSVIGTGASIIGVFLLIPVSSTAAAIVTVVGGASAVYSIQSGLFDAQVEHKRQQFIDAMYDGKFNFSIQNMSSTSTFMSYNCSEFKSFCPWNTNHYVRRVNSNIVYDVKLLTITTLQELENGTWRVVSR